MGVAYASTDALCRITVEVNAQLTCAYLDIAQQDHRNTTHVMC
jgi:hypothetical protein